MKHLTLLLPNKEHNLSTITCIIGAYEIFEFANAHYRKTGREPLFKIELTGISGQVELKAGMFTVKPESHISEIEKTNLIIIPSFNPGLCFDDEETRLLLDWIKQHYRKGSEIASLCSGAFLLAASGLLDGRNCSTHWKHTETFRKVFPKINLRADNLITDEFGIYTNGGAYSFLNLMVYLVEKYYDRQTAILCAKVFQIEMDRNVQSEFVIFTGQKQHDDELVKKAQTYLEKHLEEKINITELASKFNVGRRNFDRRFIKATGNTPIEYSQRVRIEAAKKAFETNRKTINEVMYEVGYSDVKAFREVFRKVTGMLPMQYKEKYFKDAII